MTAGGTAPAGAAARSQPALDPAVRHQQALDLAVRSLDRRDRTVLEVRRYLEAKRIEPVTVDAVVADLGESGLLDDERFAARFVEDKRRLEQWGADRIERGLLQRGVPRDLVRAALGETTTRSGELEGALGVLRRRFPLPPRDHREWQRAYGVLVRKGYDPELAADALRAHGRPEEDV